jgi:N-acetylmuramoyl-L-alanine amidase
MKLPRNSLLCRFAGAVLAVCALIAPASAAEIRAIRAAEQDEGVRVVIEADHQPAYRMFSLAEQGMRIVLDFPHLEWTVSGAPAQTGEGAGAGLVAGYRYAHNTAEISRLVLDLAVPAQVTAQTILPPGADSPNYRLVLDLAPVSAEAFAAVSGAAQAAPVFAGVEGEAQQAAFVPAAAGSGPTPAAVITSGPPESAIDHPVIVIDAGHGGPDPGTIGVNKNQEKAVTLAAALQLRDILLATGRYEVVLTRSTDVFLDLDERVAIARDNDAGLYISLHADASESRNTRGATVYTVNDRGQARTRQRVQSNTWEIVERPQTQEVGNILLDLSMTDTKNQSSTFAEMLREDVSDVTTMVQNPHREENFAVLLAPDVPAVLLEMGFMSNPTDEANLTSSGYRKDLMEAVANSIDGYFGSRLRRVAGN